MIRFIALSFLILFSIHASAQKTVVNQKTSKHVNIPGTRVFIIPPKGFKISGSGMAGLQKDENTSIQVYDLNGGNYYSNGRSVNKTSFEEKGITVLDYEECKLNNYPAKYVRINGKPPVEACQLIFGDSTFSVMLMGIYLRSDKASAKQIKECLFSAYYDTSLVIDPLATATFKTEKNTSRFRFQKQAATAFLYTIDGKEMTEKGSDPFAIVTVLPSDGEMIPEIMAKSFLNGLKQEGFTAENPPNGAEIQLNSAEAYEQTTNGFLKGKPCIVYHCVIKGKDRFIILCGMSYSDHETNLDEFKKLAQSLRFK